MHRIQQRAVLVLRVLNVDSNPHPIMPPRIIRHYHSAPIRVLRDRSRCINFLVVAVVVVVVVVIVIFHLILQTFLTKLMLLISGEGTM